MNIAHWQSPTVLNGLICAELDYQLPPLQLYAYEGVITGDYHPNVLYFAEDK